MVIIVIIMIIHMAVREKRKSEKGKINLCLYMHFLLLYAIVGRRGYYQNSRFPYTWLNLEKNTNGGGKGKKTKGGWVFSLNLFRCPCVYIFSEVEKKK